MLFLRPDLVSRDFHEAPVVSGANDADGYCSGGRAGHPRVMSSKRRGEHTGTESVERACHAPAVAPPNAPPGG